MGASRLLLLGRLLAGEDAQRRLSQISHSDRWYPLAETSFLWITGRGLISLSMLSGLSG